MDLNSMNNYKMKITMLSRLIEELEEDFETKLKKYEIKNLKLYQ